jgi:hypothetical protein
MGFDYAGKIRTLLATADSHEANGNESAAATFRAKALEWMDRYRIAEEDALAEDPAVVEPIYRIIDLTPPSSDLVFNLPLIAELLAKHCEVRIYTTHPSWGTFRFEVVGYEGDVRYFELLWTSAYLMFSTRIDPHWDDTLAPEENIHRLRRAGHTRKEIAIRAGWDGNDAKIRSKIQRIYVSQARAAGEDPAAAGLGFQANDYRRAYADEFISHLSYRLRKARDAANAAGGVVVLAGRAERVQEAFYAYVSDARPSQQPAVPYVAPNANCAKCRASKSGYCRDHAYLKPRAWTQADEDRWQRRYNGTSARAGRASGREAADGVHLRGTASPTAQRVEAANRALEG